MKRLQFLITVVAGVVTIFPNIGLWERIGALSVLGCGLLLASLSRRARATNVTERREPIRAEQRHVEQGFNWSPPPALDTPAKAWARRLVNPGNDDATEWARRLVGPDSRAD